MKRAISILLFLLAVGTLFAHVPMQRLVFPFDAENGLASVVAGASSPVTFGYAADGERLWKQSGTNLQVWIGANYEEKQGKVLFHVLAGGSVICTFDSTGTNVFEYYHSDHLRSTSILTDRNGNRIQHHEYSAYGRDRFTESSTAFPVSRRYTSQVLDEDTGLYFYGARYYDPQLGRFIQPDTIIPSVSNPQHLNPYSYCLNNPLRYTDPSGHAPEDDDDEIPLSYRQAHAASRQAQGGASAQLYNKSIADAKGTAAIGRNAAEMIPWVGGSNSGRQLITGKDAIDSHRLTKGERVKSGAWAAASVGPWFLKAGKWVRAGAKTAEAARNTRAAAGVLRIGDAANQISRLNELDVVIGLAKEGKILAHFKYGDDFASAMSHHQLAEKLGVLAERGKLAQGVEAFTVAKQRGGILVRGSNNFDPKVTAGTEKLLKEKFQ